MPFKGHQRTTFAAAAQDLSNVPAFLGSRFVSTLLLFLSQVRLRLVCLKLTWKGNPELCTLAGLMDTMPGTQDFLRLIDFVNSITMAELVDRFVIYFLLQNLETIKMVGGRGVPPCFFLGFSDDEIEPSRFWRVAQDSGLVSEC